MFLKLNKQYYIFKTVLYDNSLNFWLTAVLGYQPPHSVAFGDWPPYGSVDLSFT